MSAGEPLGSANPPSFGNRFRRLAAKRGILLPNLTLHNCNPLLLNSIELSATY